MDGKNVEIKLAPLCTTAKGTPRLMAVQSPIIPCQGHSME